MKITIYPSGPIQENCLVLVGGSGDTTEGFQPIVTKISEKLPDYSICTFSFSTHSEAESLLDLQSRELDEVFSEITTKYNFKKIDVFCTSMGAYATIRLLNNKKYQNLINQVIMFDPADYYLSAKFANSDDVTWSGPQEYNPIKPVISSELSTISGNCIVSVVHLTLSNYGVNGYIQKEFKNRGIDDPNGYPRLSTEMVKAFYAKVPTTNSGKYIEQNLVPHAILRDGNIPENLDHVVDLISKLLAK
ncbi:hypothetical protein KBD75_02555 [Candidatus Woesebacteria bacterium]|nr:hypothetical protein [Candidatus Woesebacteria bacterium]